MSRVTPRATVAALVACILGPLPLTTAQAAPETFGIRAVVAGGGDGWSGPASRARVDVDSMTDGAPDGSVLVTNGDRVLRVQPATDRLEVVAGTVVAQGQRVVDVAALGAETIVATSTGVVRASNDGSTTTLLVNSGVRAVDGGADGVVWVATRYDVLRILADGTVQTVTTSDGFGDALDLAVTPDGTKAYVLDNGIGRYGVYEVTPTGVGPRVAGNLKRDDSLQAGYPAASASTESVRSLTTDGTTITLASREYQRIVRFAVGGVLSQVTSGPCTTGITTRGTELIAMCREPSESLHRFSSSGTDLGRIFGADPAQPWSPDGVRATDAYLDGVRGGAGLPDGLVVFTTAHGLVREVGADGLLRTRARLAPISKRGKVALAPDGTAYVVTDAGTVMAVASVGGATQVPIDAAVVDVEVRSDGRLVVADGAGHRLLLVPPAGGISAVLTDGIAAPADIAIDGDSVLVADTGLRRVAADGAVSTLLTGGNPTVAAATPGGVWTNPSIGYTEGLAVLLPSGGLAPVRADRDLVAQVQSVGNGDVVLSGGDTVRRVSDAGLPEAAAPPAVTATPGSGRVVLDWDDNAVNNIMIRAKRGSQAPGDMWDGVGVGGDHTVLRIGGEPLQAGDEWTFAVFAMRYVRLDDYNSVPAWSPAATVTASALPDTTPPPAPGSPHLYRDHTTIAVVYYDPQGDDFSHSVVRMALGTTPPPTPTDGSELWRSEPGTLQGVNVPDPIRGQDYAISIFTVDFHGNYARWSAVARLDFDAPGQVTALEVTPSYSNARFRLTPPSDPDYNGIQYAVAEGSAVPPRPAPGYASTMTEGTLYNLRMDTDYTLAVWSSDTTGNVSEPVVTHFRTLLDTVSPAAVAGLTAVGGTYQVSASWTPPTDADLSSVTATLVNGTTGVSAAAVGLTKTSTGYTWTRVAGGTSFTVRVSATDTNGLVSDVATATALTDPDANGAPAPIDLATVTVKPASSTSVTVSFPRPAISDLKSLGYAVVAVGQSIDTVAVVYPLPTSSATVTRTITLPQALTAYQLVLYVWDFNSNRARTTVPEVKGEVNPAELPPAPSILRVTSPSDNALEVRWTTSLTSVSATSWTVTATSGTLSRSVTVDGTARLAGFHDLTGRQDWTVFLVGKNVLGTGVTGTAAAVTVGDLTPPAPVTKAARTPSYDTELLTWVNPAAFDFNRVEVFRRGATSAESALIYRGRGTSVRATGLVAGRSYSFEIRAYDYLGNVAAMPVLLTTRQSALTLSLASTLRYGSYGKASGVLKWGSSYLAGKSVSVFAQKVGSATWTRVAGATTSSTGAFAVYLKPLVNTRYRIGYAGTGGVGGSYSATRTVGVAPVVSMKASRTSLYLGRTVTFSTTVAPWHGGRSIALQRWTGTTWVTVATRTLSSTSAASATVRTSARGRWSYRWVLASHTDHATGVSASVRISVI